MKKIALLMFFCASLFVGQAQTKNFIDKPYLETSALYTTTVVPDKIFLSILITEADTKGKTSVEELENKMAAKLKSLGIDIKKQLTLEDLASNFQKYFLRKKDVLKNKSYTLLVYDAETAGKVILGLESIDISNVQLAKTEYSKLEELKIELRGKAVAKAKTQAEALLKPLDQKAGKALYISDMNTNLRGAFDVRSRNVKMAYTTARQESEFQPLDIEFEKITVESSVTVYFEIL
ncbi:MAG: SIMPL domain-containing protein [Bacteroidota bacterium]